MFAGVVVAGVCSPLVLAWLAGGGVAFARLWWPRVCSLGRWLASVCLGSVVAAGFVVACHGYAAWDAVPPTSQVRGAVWDLHSPCPFLWVGRCVSLEEFTGVSLQSEVYAWLLWVLQVLAS